MQKNNRASASPDRRLGVHYFPDSLHYRETDLAAWLPELTQLGAGWTILQSETERAIPETFIGGLVKAGIQPIVQFHLPLGLPPAPESLRTLLEAYSSWGVKQVLFFDRPNSRSAWSASSWAQQDLVERFLDRFLPFANLAIETGLNPIFPALEPGGHFWDTAFLWTALQSIERRKQQKLIDRLTLAAYAWTHQHSLNWGCGGPQRWPEVRPYFTPPGDQDQCGFRAYAWYQAIAQAVLQVEAPVILLQAGLTGDPSINSKESHACDLQTCLSIAHMLDGDPVFDPSSLEVTLEGLEPSVIAANFWLLAADSADPAHAQAWYESEGQPRGIALQMKARQHGTVIPTGSQASAHSVARVIKGGHLIEKYVLLPTYEWGAADWHWNIIQPFVKKHHPTVGYSLEEAALAGEVLVIGGEDGIKDEDLSWLRQIGCQVERISGDGTNIASVLAER